MKRTSFSLGFGLLALVAIVRVTGATESATNHATQVGVAVDATSISSEPVCESEKAQLYSGFRGARLTACEALGSQHFSILSAPESAPPINPSPWYAFRVVSKPGVLLVFDLTYGTYKHRYRPKISLDGTVWTGVPEADVQVKEDGSARVSLEAPAASFYVAGQEILTAEAQDNWLKSLENVGVTVTALGSSPEGRPILKAEHKPAEGNRYILITGRQHPPEVTGALALMPFVDTLFADTPLANEFRTRFGIIVVPVLNPDGVTHGHWRHNTGDTDLNRDWGPFTQPETRLMQQELMRFAGGGSDSLSLFLDFHSTHKNVLYTQADSEATKVPQFARHWVKAVKNHGLMYQFERAERPLTDKPTAKNYMYRTYGIPSITYEVADTADRQALKDAAVVFAEEMMQILLTN